MTTCSKPTLGLVEFVSLMAMMTSLVALSIDAMLPALGEIGSDLRSPSPQQTYLIISLFFIGMAIGQLIFGPLSDAKGRRFAILSGLGVFCIGTLICYLAPSMEILLFGRIVQAIGASGPRIATIALIRDQYEGNAMARVMSFIMVVFILVPMLAPLFGQVIMIWLSWRDIFTSFFIISLCIGLWFYIRQPETLPASRRKPFQVGELQQSLSFIFRHPVVMGNTIAMGFIFGAFLAYLSASQTIFVTFYSVGEWFPACFAFLAFAIGAASFINGRIVFKFGMYRLSFFANWGFLITSAVLLVACVSFDGIPPLALTLLLLFVAFGFVGILFGNLNAMAMQPLGENAGVGAAVIGSLSSLMSVPIAVFLNAFIDRTITPVAAGFVIMSVIAVLALGYARKAYENDQPAEEVVS